MADEISKFQEAFPSLDSYWRSIVLFGNNVASYKFALAKSLLELSDRGQTSVALDELAQPFSKHICEHILHSPKQATSGSSRFLDACRQFNAGEISYDQLMNTTVKLGFNNVIDAFHVVNRAEIPVRFYEKDYSASGKRIILTDDIYKLGELTKKTNLNAEAESRWNLVETAWELGINRNLLDVRYDDTQELLFVNARNKRKDVTSVRGALNGYQKGRCFYCFDDILVSDDADNECDVDHFFPHTLQHLMPDVNLNGVWNLVLCCKKCNRGNDGKFARVPAIKYLERLHRRNEYLISSHHPLRETIMNQTGNTEEKRVAFLNEMNIRAMSFLLHTWETPEVKEATF